MAAQGLSPQKLLSKCPVLPYSAPLDEWIPVVHRGPLSRSVSTRVIRTVDGFNAHFRRLTSPLEMLGLLHDPVGRLSVITTTREWVSPDLVASLTSAGSSSQWSASGPAYTVRKEVSWSPHEEEAGRGFDPQGLPERLKQHSWFVKPTAYFVFREPLEEDWVGFWLKNGLVYGVNIPPKAEYDAFFGSST